eukprot:782432-Prymnesium_polylepis.1
MKCFAADCAIAEVTYILDTLTAMDWSRSVASTAAAFFASFGVNGRCVCPSPTSMLRRLHDTLSS